MGDMFIDHGENMINSNVLAPGSQSRNKQDNHKTYTVCNFIMNMTKNIIIHISPLFSGRWSGDPPRCVPVRCPALEIADPHLRVLALNNSFQVGMNDTVSVVCA